MYECSLPAILGEADSIIATAVHSNLATAGDRVIAACT